MQKTSNLIHHSKISVMNYIKKMKENNVNRFDKIHHLWKILYKQGIEVKIMYLILCTETLLRYNIYSWNIKIWDFQVVLEVKNLPANAGDIRDTVSILGSGRSPGVGHGNPLQYSFLENSMDRGDQWATVHRVAQSKIQLKQLSTYMCMISGISQGFPLT